MARDCTIRHPVRPIVALQRRMRFSARLAEFCRDRCHQRRARRAERASFSAFVSNPDFRVPRLRPNRRTGADLAVRPPRRSHPSDPESRPGLSRRRWPSTFWSRCSQGLLDVHLSPGLDPGSRSSPESVASRFWTFVSPRVPGTPNRRPQRPGEINAGLTFCGAQVEKRPSREAQNRGRGYRGVAGLARSGPGGPGPPCVLTYLRFGLNQGPAMLERVLAPSLVSQFGSSSPLRGLVGDREDRVRQPPPERLVVAELLEQLRVVL